MYRPFVFDSVYLIKTVPRVWLSASVRKTRLRTVQHCSSRPAGANLHGSHFGGLFPVLHVPTMSCIRSTIASESAFMPPSLFARGCTPVGRSVPVMSYMRSRTLGTHVGVGISSPPSLHSNAICNKYPTFMIGKINAPIVILIASVIWLITPSIDR